MNTVNELVVLYSKAIEFYNGMNDEKYTYFESRIQNLLIRPEVLKMMTKQNQGKYTLDGNPPKSTKTEKELYDDRMKANEQRKKDRVSKLKANSEVSEELKAAIDPVYKATALQVENQAALEKEARKVINLNISQ